MRPLKIAVAVPIFPNLAQTYILRLIDGLKSAGMKITVIAAYRRKYDRLPPEFDWNSMLDDITYLSNHPLKILIGLLLPPLHQQIYRKALGQLLDYRSQYSKTYFIKALYRLKAIASREFEIIHSHSLFSSHDLLFMKEAIGIPMIMTYHGQVPRGVPKLPGDKLQRVLDTMDAFVVNTDYARDELVTLGCDHAKIHIIPQGIKLDDFPFRRRRIDPESRIILLTISRLSIEKGHHLGIRALKHLQNCYPSLEYHLVGDGPEKKELQRLARELGLAERVRFHGFKSGTALHEILASAHLFTLPSINTGDGYLVETQGVVLQEAQASGIPVVASRTGGIPDVIEDGKTGLLFDEGNHEALARNIRELIEDPELYSELALQGRREVESRFDIAVVCKRLHSLYMKYVN